MAEDEERPELPLGQDLPHEASPGGVEGVDPGWRGGSSEVLGPEPDFDTTYSTKDVSDAVRREEVGPFTCAYCEQTFKRPSELKAHLLTHRDA